MQKFLENVPTLATSGRQNSAMTTDCRKLTAKINLYGMSSFYFYYWNQFSHSPGLYTPYRWTYIPQAPTVSLLMIGCRLRTMRYICNHQVAPWTIYIEQMGAIRPILFTIKNSNCAKNKVDVLHVRLTELDTAHQNLPFPPNRTLPLEQYQYQGRLCYSFQNAAYQNLPCYLLTYGSVNSGMCRRVIDWLIDLLGLAARGWIKTYTYRHTCSKKLGLYIEYIHTIKSASGAGSSKVSTVWKNSCIGLYERELLDIST